MHAISLGDTAFGGVSRSITYWRGKTPHPTCRRCGSSLAKGCTRIERDGTELFRCPCGGGRRIKRTVAAMGATTFRRPLECRAPRVILGHEWTGWPAPTLVIQTSSMSAPAAGAQPR
jgi:NAD-dependent SIR2 family protein deacetylase